MRLIQFLDESEQVRVAEVLSSPSEGNDAVQGGFGSVAPLADACLLIDLASQAWRQGQSLREIIRERRKLAPTSYRPLLNEGRVLPPVTARDPRHHLLSGTGLTHKKSASARHGMHVDAQETLTDSMRLFRLGLAEGKPSDGSWGVQPEWFFKGNGHNLVAPGQPLCVPNFTLDAGEEPEIVGHYWISESGEPCRLGFSLGNELSDHVMEKQNYLYLAHSKLRPCSVGPELLLGDFPTALRGRSRIRRGDELVWDAHFLSGEDHMTHRVTSLEYHHFKYSLFRSPDSVHSHFFGTATLSCSEGIRTQPGDVFEISCPDFGAPLENALQMQVAPPATPVARL